VANLTENDHAFLLLLDPACRQRIKLWGRARVVENDAVLVEWLSESGYKARPERAILFAIEVWDVNCASHIITRFFEAEIEQTLSTVQAKIAELETENTRLRSLLAQRTPQ
jgi:predicted pyridoxine 5'-phosphate oxidase superfamily flavin-nucleotide-binding protein